MAAKGRDISIYVDLPASDETYGWDLSTAVLQSGSASVVGQDTLAIAILYNNDGTKLYYLGDANNRVFQYSLSTPYDGRTITFDAVGLTVTPEEPNPRGMSWNSDGTSLFVIGYSNYIHKYDLTTAYDLSTASYSGTRYATTGVSNPRFIEFGNNGLKMYMTTSSAVGIRSYTLASAYDISTAVYAGVSEDYYPGGPISQIQSVKFSSDGLKMFVMDSSYGLESYTLSNAWRVNTATYDSTYVTPGGSNYDAAFDPTGVNLTILNQSSAILYQYTITPSIVGTPGGYTLVGLLRSKTFTINCNPVDITDYDSDDWRTLESSGLSEKSMSVSGSGVLDTENSALQYLEDAVWDGVEVDLKLVLPNGDFYTGTFKVVSFGRSGDMSGIVPFTMSIESTVGSDGSVPSMTRAVIAFIGEICSSVYDTASFDVSAYTSVINSLEFTSDGSSFVVTDGSNNASFQYDLSTPGDVTTAVIGNALSWNSVDTDVADLIFGDNGNKLYILGRQRDTIYELDLSTPYRIATWSDSGNSLDISSEDPVNSLSIQISPDGTKVFMLSDVEKSVFRYDLGVAWDISSASLSQTYTYSLVAQGYLQFRINSDGTKIYMLDTAEETVFQYEMSTPWDLDTAALDTGCEFNFTESTTMRGIALSEGVYKLYLGSNDSPALVYQYSLP